jgi:predicted MPP superfamily phosphohydrolase
MQPNRRQVLTGIVGAGAAGAAGLGADMLLWEPRAVRWTDHEVDVWGLHPDLEGLRIAQLTDVHLGSGHAAARRCAELLAEDRPDIVVLTGDIVESEAGLATLSAWLPEVRGTLATFQAMGNWERWGGLTRAQLDRACEKGGARLLLDETAVVRRGAGTLDIVGLDDGYTGDPQVAAALRERSGGPAVWLAHAPGWVDDIKARARRESIAEPRFILSGHTHGGQVRHPFGPITTPPGSGRFVRGWYHDTLAPTYVSQGVGTSLLPVRLFCRPELPVFTLVRGRS